MYYVYDEKNSIKIPKPFGRVMTPIFMGDDPISADCGFSVHMTEWEPGCCVDNHFHETETEAMYCISGKGIAQIGEAEHPFFPGSMVVAPPGITHQIINTGTECLRVLCIFSPPSTDRALMERAMKAIDLT